MLCWPNAKIITAVNDETKDQFVRLSRMNVKLKQPPLLNRLFNMSNIVSNMGIINKNAREEGYRVTVYDNKRILLSKRQWRWGSGCMLSRTRSWRSFPGQPPDRDARTRSGRREEWEDALGSGQHWGKESDGDGTDKIPIFPPPEDGCSPKPPKSSYRPPPYSRSPHAVSECPSKEINIKLTMYDDYQTL